MGSMSLMHWVIVLAIVLVLFGAGKLPRMMGDFAKGIKAFKAGMKEEDETAAEATPHQQVPPPAGTATSAAAAGTSSAFGNGRDQRV
jgi:sec-independent protein translocase protein TatA